MKKGKFIVKSFRNTTISSLIDVVKKVKKQTKKKFVLFDILYCAIKYQAAFHDYLEFEFYLLNNTQRKTYLTNGKNNEIVKMFNDKNFWHIIDNKNEFNDYFKKYLKRDYLNPNFTKEELYKFIQNKDKIIVKPVNGIGGEGIEIIDTKKNDIYEKYGTYLLEEVITQHPKLNELYPKSVNSLRIFTFFDGKDSHLLQVILKIGNKEVVDNFSSGGMYAFLDDNGTVMTPAIDKDDNFYGVHPTSKKQILGFKVPMFNEAIELALNAAKEIEQIKYIGWDIAITSNGPCIIEGNSYPGIYQIKPRFDKNKTGILPKYEKIMKIKL